MRVRIWRSKNLYVPPRCFVPLRAVRCCQLPARAYPTRRMQAKALVLVLVLSSLVVMTGGLLGECRPRPGAVGGCGLVCYGSALFTDPLPGQTEYISARHAQPAMFPSQVDSKTLIIRTTLRCSPQPSSPQTRYVSLLQVRMPGQPPSRRHASSLTPAPFLFPALFLRHVRSRQPEELANWLTEAFKCRAYACAVTQIGVKLQGIKSAQKQVVAGLNYKLLLETDDGLYDATVYSAHRAMRSHAFLIHGSAHCSSVLHSCHSASTSKLILQCVSSQEPMHSADVKHSLAQRVWATLPISSRLTPRRHSTW